jgi:hypothetical protein
MDSIGKRYCSEMHEMIIVGSKINFYKELHNF